MFKKHMKSKISISIFMLLIGIQPGFSQTLKPMKFLMPEFNTGQIISDSNKTNFKNVKNIINLRSSGNTVFKKVLPSVVKVLAEDGHGSGIFIELDKDYFIITNNHVTTGNIEVGIQLPDDTDGKKILLGRVIMYDEIKDLALVKLNSLNENIESLPFAANDINIGDDVHAIGHPLGEDWTYTRGYVSQKRDNYTWQSDETEHHLANVIQTQTPINPGNSGGPLVNNNGELVGINTFTNRNGEGMNFSVANSSIQEFLNSSGTVKRIMIDIESFNYGTLINTWDDNKNGHPDIYGFDRSANEIIDLICIDENEDTIVDALLVDNNENGIYEATVEFNIIFEGKRITIMHYDEDEDGIVESRGYDMDMDGKIDHIIEVE